jgi:Tfp pilus assembly protein PilF
LDGAAYVTLGTLYYMVPGWPVSFGDNQLAEQMLKASLKINPNGIDANYFYADYLLQQDRSAEAEEYLHKAIQAPLRKQQVFADSQLQNEAKLALAHTQQRKSNAGKNKFQSLFTSATAD